MLFHWSHPPVFSADYAKVMASCLVDMISNNIVLNNQGQPKVPETLAVTKDTNYKGQLSCVWDYPLCQNRNIDLVDNHHHHHVVMVAWISLTLSRHFSLSFIASGRSSGLHPVSSHSCWMYVRAGRPAFARPCVGVHKSKSLMSSSLLLQPCPACLVRLTWIVFVIGGRWPYSWCLVGCCRQDLFKIARSILV